MRPIIACPVIFDVDGTLCDTSAVDTECYLMAAGEFLDTSGLAEVSWAACPQVTDPGVLDWLWLQCRHRVPTEEERNAFAERFFRMIQEASRRDPSRFLPIAGAARLLAVLPQCGCTVAVATGGWRLPALVKLQAAGIPGRLLVASADDSKDRTTIFQLARERTTPVADVQRHSTVLVGDGTWDAKVARDLRWRFIGVGSGRHAERLRDEGATAVFPDLGDVDAFLRAVRVHC